VGGGDLITIIQKDARRHLEGDDEKTKSDQRKRWGRGGNQIAVETHRNRGKSLGLD